MEKKTPFVSIVVCTYNRARFLQENLKAFLHQRAVNESYEVIVVDNGSTDKTAAVVKSYAAEIENLRYLSEPRLGLSNARNRGYREAKSDWVVYLDDDAQALPDFVARLFFIIKNYDFDAFGGSGIPIYPYGKPKWCKDLYYSNQELLPKIGELSEKDFLSGFNCAFKKKWISRYGGFSPSIGMRGKRISFGEETLLQMCLKKDGKRIAFDPDLVVLHAVMPYKLRVSWFLSTAFILGRESWQFFAIKPSALKILSSVVDMFASSFLNTIPLLLRLLKKNFYFQNFLVDLLRPSLYNAGKLFGVISKPPV